MRTIAGILCACVLAAAAASGAGDQGLAVKGVRYFSYPGFTRIVFETESAASYVMTRSGDGRSLYFSSYGGPFTVAVSPLPVINDGVVKGLELRRDGDKLAVIIVLASGAGTSKDFVLRGPDRIVLDVFRGAPAPPAPEAGRTVIMIDPGHGGTDTGIVTGQGPEKAFTLELANALRRRLTAQGKKMTVLLTREQDRSMNADERAAAANAAEAQVFVSLHLTQSADDRVFILDPDEGRAIAAAGAPGDFLGFDAVSEQQQMLWGTQQAEHAQDSGRLGRAVIRSISGRETAEPDQAPLLVLEPVAAAAVLVELGAGRNPAHAADAIARGIEQYVRERR
jgi:N-acetylmuramoyl-L-alanine amidase